MNLFLNKYLAFLTIITLLACGNSSDDGSGNPVTPNPSDTESYRFVEAFSGLEFNNPVELVNAGDGSNRLFVVERRGTIKFFNATQSSPSPTDFLNISSKVRSGGEMGLLGLAFHPNFESNGFFFVNYTKDNPHETVIARYKVNTPASGVADPGSETILFTFAQPYSNHNGGSIHFGPDGYLYIATGDGGSGGDPQNNAQNKGSLLGKILRVDVNATDKGNYGIPADNPFVSESGARPEIYAYGLRNPWRISFDPETKQLWTGDVGQNAWEEIDIITKGGNYGWRLKEGDHCYNPSSNCEQTGLIDPVWEYSHSNGDRSVTGGYVYRGKKLPGLVGKYIYGDYVSGRVWALEAGNNTTPKNSRLAGTVSSLSTLGVDEQNELYFCSLGNGKIFTLSTATP
ncbi:MAG: PQQ-dependent sugar dehydrogenase [Bacteroidetes bacterium]|nr:PQQ-dependent sugar dehydrogenase [Bacteroidota bacterium]